MKPSLRSLGPALLTSRTLRGLRRGLAAAPRRLTRARPLVRYFHQADDPYSYLAARALPHLERIHAVQVMPHIVPPPDAAAAPDAPRLRDWSLRDAGTLATGLALAPTLTAAPDAAQVQAAEAALAGVTDATTFAAACADLERAFMHAGPMPAVSGDARAALARGAAERARRGHYLGGTFHFEGEWYWGLDRLPYLEARLAQLAGGGQPFVPRLEVTLTAGALQRRPVLEAFISLRSPYSYIAMPRLLALADAYQAELRLRPVLPMVMRGLPVPLAKRLYIVLDTRREAERLGLPFGRIADPVGRPAERGLAVLFAALQAGRGPDFALSFLQGVFAEGIDANRDAGLRHLCERAGISAAQMQAALADDGWRSTAEANREAMLALGLWGVPSFRVDDRPAHWGQDRLWAVEADLRAAASMADAGPD